MNVFYTDVDSCPVIMTDRTQNSLILRDNKTVRKKRELCIHTIVVLSVG